MFATLKFFCLSWMIKRVILEFYQQFLLCRQRSGILKWDLEDVWTKRSIIEPLEKFREFDLENHVMQETSKTIDLVIIMKKNSEDFGIKIEQVWQPYYTHEHLFQWSAGATNLLDELCCSWNFRIMLIMTW